MSNDSNETNDHNSNKRNDSIIESEGESRITLSESPVEAFAHQKTDLSSKPPLKRQISQKSLKGLNRNKIFPQKLPPIKKSKTMKRMNKIKQERGKTIPLNGFEVKWNNLSYIVEKPSFGCGKSMPSYRVILKCLTGSFASSQLTAVMGPSGAGKSSLLSCVCGKRTTGVSGDIIISGCNRIKVSIITQNDYLTDKFTLREGLLFASKVKNGRKNDHDEIINNVVNSLGLEGCLDTRMGKCSGGQRRKISIALELVSNPNILILDEPTSGLDSSACYQIVENLRELTQHKKNPMAIVATIHQPSARVFSLFHNIYVISHNGQAIYHGAPDKLVYHLNQVHISVPDYYNPADYILEIASGEYGEEYITKLATQRKESLMSLEVIDTQKEGSKTHKLSQLSQRRKYSNVYHLIVLVERQFRLLLREPHMSWLRIISSTMTGILMGLLFSKDLGQVSGCPPRMETLYSNNPSELYNNFEYEHKALTQNLGSIFFSILYIMYAGLMPMILVFPMEFNNVTKHYTNGWYSTFTYFLSKVVSELPLSILGKIVIFPIKSNILFSVIILYFGFWYTLSSQIWELWRFSLILLNGLLLLVIGQSIGMICSAIFSTNPISAGYSAITATTPFVVLSDFFIRSTRIPFYLKPLTALSFTKYSFEASVITLYGYERCWYEETNRTGVEPPSWLRFLKTMTATMITGNGDDRDLDTYEDDTDDQAMNDVLSMITGKKVSSDEDMKFQSLVMSEFNYEDFMLPYSLIILGVFALILLTTAYFVFLIKLRKNN